MKFLKKTILLITLVISFCLLSVNVKAFESTYDINYDFIYDNVILKAQEQNFGFSFEEYSNFYCYFSSSGRCYFFKDDDLNKFTINRNTDTSAVLRYSETFDYYYIIFSKELSIFDYGLKNISTISNYLSYTIYTNMSEYKDLPNAVYLESTLEEEPKELEVTIKGTEILTSMLDKTKNIYEVLIANQLFVLCSCILLSYLVFIILYKTIRK